MEFIDYLMDVIKTLAAVGLFVLAFLATGAFATEGFTIIAVLTAVIAFVAIVYVGYMT